MYPNGSVRPTPFALDPVLPVWDYDPIELNLPLDSQVFILQGPFARLTHAGYWGYDLSYVDGSFERSSPPGSLDNADYFVFGAPLRAPASGTVVNVTDSVVDNLPYCMFDEPPCPRH